MSFAEEPAETSGIPLSAPYYGASFGVAVRRFWKKYSVFVGRASNSEFWWSVLFIMMIGVALDVVGIVLFAIAGFFSAARPTSSQQVAYYVFGALVMLCWAGIVIPELSAMVRRLHDTNRSGWYLLLILIPWVGQIILIVFLAGASNPLGERFDSVSPR